MSAPIRRPPIRIVACEHDSPEVVAEAMWLLTLDFSPSVIYLTACDFLHRAAATAPMPPRSS